MLASLTCGFFFCHSSEQCRMSRLLRWKGAVESITRLVYISGVARRQKAHKHKQVTKSLFGVFSLYAFVFRHRGHDMSSPREVDAVLKFLKEQCGAKHIGAVGFCWGGVATHYLSLQYPEVKAGVSVYGMS